MAVLTPDAVRIEHGLTINEKIIPDSAVWNKNYGDFKKGEQYKANLLLSGGTGEVKGVTIHNTDRVSISSKTTQAEQYTRATYPNCNMGSVRVHYYVDDICAWQNLRENEVGWHSGDGNDGSGNGETVGIEIIMDGSGDEKDIAAENNGALLAAILLHRHRLSLDRLYTHNDFSAVNKYCPAYLLPRWEEFEKKVKTYLDEINDGATDYKTLYENTSLELSELKNSIRQIVRDFSL